MDLGCGSGLSGEEFRTCVGHLTGVDLNPEMAKEARDRGCYDRIVVGDADYHEGILYKDDDGEENVGIWDYDFIFACDLFAYIGGEIRVSVRIFRSLIFVCLFVWLSKKQ